MSADGLAGQHREDARRGRPDAAIEAFATTTAARRGRAGMIPEDELEPVDRPPDAADLPDAEPAEALDPPSSSS